MDLKKIIMMCMATVLGAMIFITSFSFLFQSGNESIFSKAGKSAVSKDYKDTETETDDIIEGIQNTPAPEVKYTGGTQHIGNSVNIKSLLSVKTAGSANFVNGSTETDFDIYIIDVLDQNRTPVQTVISGDYDPSDEAVSPAYFDEENSTVIFNDTGVFHVSVKVTGKNGRVTMVEIKVPVEG